MWLSGYRMLCARGSGDVSSASRACVGVSLYVRANLILRSMFDFGSDSEIYVKEDYTYINMYIYSTSRHTNAPRTPLFSRIARTQNTTDVL